MEVESVIIRSRALTQMLGYAIEVYKNECTGVLMGDSFRTAGKVVINSAVALQTAEREYTGVTPKWHRYDRITEVLSFLSLDWIVGEFHSHTDYRNKRPSYRLSDPDKEYIQSIHHTGEIELVIALYRKKRKREWEYTNNARVLKGTLGKYSIEIGAYYKSDENDSGTLSEIWCPIVEIANIASELDMSPSPGYIFSYIPPQFHAGRFRKLTRLIRKYEDKVISTLDFEAGEDLLQEKIQPLMQEIAALSEIYG